MDAYKDSLLYFMIFLRITPLVPNSFVNMASPVVGIPFHIFFFGTLLVSAVLAKHCSAVNADAADRHYCCSNAAP
jgi:uncharacterized membrane protein YdjX (TVP38/TMEM64 family)